MIYDVIIVGGGPAGLSAAQTAKEQGLEKVLIVERDKELGGILNQCVHNGFGLNMFKEELTGPEFSGRLIEKVRELGVEIFCDTMVLKIEEDHTVHIINPIRGYQVLKAKAVIIACGCREKSRGAIATPGNRCAGIYSAGAAQKYLNIDGYLVGKRVVILGSGDIGLIMARRMTLEGAKVLAVIEINPYSSGLARNIQQCLNDFDIPLYLNHTIVDVKGKNRVEKVTMAEVDAAYNPIPGTEVEFDCDTLLLSVGLIPENELSKDAGIQMDAKTKGPLVYENMETSLPGVFVAGNMVHVHDLADNAAMEAQRAAMGAYNYINNPMTNLSQIQVVGEKPINYTVPQRIHKEFRGDNITMMFRVGRRVEVTEQFVFRDSQGNLLGTQRTKLLGIGEMVKITIKREIIEKADKELRISVEAI